MKKLIIYGASFVDTIRVVHTINKHKPTWEIIGFIDDNPQFATTRICGYPILGNYEYLKEYISKSTDIHVFNNVNPSIAIHKLIGNRIDSLQVKVPSLVHPDIDTEYVTIGKGVFIPQGCILGCNTVIGDYVTFRYGAIISHDVTIGNNVFIGPGAVCTSHTVIESEAYLGACSTIINKVILGEGSITGASTLVNKNVPPGATVVGIPARELSK